MIKPKQDLPPIEPTDLVEFIYEGNTHRGIVFDIDIDTCTILFYYQEAYLYSTQDLNTLKILSTHNRLLLKPEKAFNV